MASIDDDDVSAAASTFSNPKKVSKAKKKKTRTDVAAAGSSMAATVAAAAPAQSWEEILQTPRKTHCANRFVLPSTAVAATGSTSRKVSATPFPIALFDASKVNRVTDKQLLKQLSKEPYNLTDIPGMSPSSSFQGYHTDDYDKVKEWIEKVLREDADDDAAFKIEKNSLVKCYELPIDIFTSSKIKPDVIVYLDKDKPIVLIEVVSSPHIVTVRKLCWDLVHHLIWIRNSATEITEWSGFVFPYSFTSSKTEESCVSQVSCKWDEKKAIFSFDVTPLVQGDVKARFLRTLKGQYTLMKGIASFQSITTSIPLAFKSDCLAQLGEGYYQLPSIQSILLASDAERMVLKFPLNITEREKLLAFSETFPRLLRRANVLSVDELQFLVPLHGDDDEPAFKVIGDNDFFCFPMLIPPMSRKEARRCLGDFYESVSEAISQLHAAASRAHSDIRLENICFREIQGQYKAVLIDLDRAQRCSEKFDFIGEEVSVMYPKAETAPAVFTYRNLDWYQLGVMLNFCLFGDDETTYHKMELKDAAAEPFSTLLKGERCPSSHKFNTTSSLEDVIKERTI